MKNLKGTICFTVGLNPPAFAVKISNKATGFFFVHFSVLRTVAMAITNRKDNHFLLFSAYSQTSRKLPPYNVKLIDPMQKWLPSNFLLFVFKIASLTSFGITNSLQFLSQKRG